MAEDAGAIIVACRWDRSHPARGTMARAPRNARRARHLQDVAAMLDDHGVQLAALEPPSDRLPSVRERKPQADPLRHEDDRAAGLAPVMP
jgi:hypothetical protein